MIPDYFDMLSGFPILISDVGHIKSPLVKDLYPPDGLGIKGYNFFLNVLSWDKEYVIKYHGLIGTRNYKKLENEALSAYDVITLIESTRELMHRVLSFFMVEDLIWDNDSRQYITVTVNEDGVKELVGSINKDNFESIRKAILRLNYIGLNEDEAPVKHSSQQSKEAWDKVQKYLSEQAKSQPDRPEYHVGNIISKLCACHPSYNLFNVYNLTIFQLYDAFFQVGFLRGSNLNERIFSQHGGKSFKFEEWLKPLIKYI